MSNKINLLYLTLDPLQASTRYRVSQFIDFYPKEIYTIEVIPIIGVNFFYRIYICCFYSHKFDVIILHRKPLAQYLVFFLALKAKLIFDYDDALFARESYIKNNPKSHQPGSKQTINRLNYILKKCTSIFAGNNVLKNYSLKYNSNVELVPTSIPIPTYNTALKPSNKLKIGWIGTGNNLFYLELLDNECAKVQQNFPDTEFSIMCDSLPKNCKTNWILDKWSKENEAKWLSSIDVGLMPLSDDTWSSGKCAFKLIQYMSFKKAVIASAVGANKEAIVNNENGFLIFKNEQWYDAIHYYIINKDKILSHGEKSYKIFLEKFEISKTFNTINNKLLEITNK